MYIVLITIIFFKDANYSLKDMHTKAVMISFFYLFIFGHTACGILVPQPGIEPGPPALEAWSLNHWTAREVPHFCFRKG